MHVTTTPKLSVRAFCLTIFSSLSYLAASLRARQTDIEARVRQDVEKARRRREEASAKDENRRVEEHRRKTAVSGRWAAVTTDGTRLLSATKVNPAADNRALCCTIHWDHVENRSCPVLSAVDALIIFSGVCMKTTIGFVREFSPLWVVASGWHGTLKYCEDDRY